MPYLWVLHTGEEMSPVLLSYYILANLHMLPLIVKKQMWTLRFRIQGSKTNNFTEVTQEKWDWKIKCVLLKP